AVTRAGRRRIWLASLLIAVGTTAFAAALRPWLTQLAALPVPQRLLYLLIPAVLLGAARPVGLGLAGLLLYGAVWTDGTILLWFVVPLLVTALASGSVGMPLRLALDGGDIDGRPLL